MRRVRTPPPSESSRPRHPDGERESLLHELRVHQVELEMQNQELQAARREVEEALQRYTELFDFAPIGYAILAPSGTIEKVNHTGARLLGPERSQLAGLPFFRFVDAGGREAFFAMLAAAARGTGGECEVELVAPGGGARLPARLTARRIARGAGITILLAFEDISEHRAREEQLATERVLREIDRRKDDFLAALSHELRNPLAPIRNSLTVLERCQPGSEQARKAQAICDRQVAHLTRLVDDLLDVSRVTRGKIQLRRTRLDLGELVRGTLDDQRPIFEASGIRLEGRIDAGPSWVDGDADRLVQVLTNLLRNAEKFTPPGGEVVVGLRREGARVALTVRDTGAGIAPELLPHLFEPFLQAQQTLDRARGGLGLGLATVKGLVELHGGTVAIRSEGPGRGTEVTVWLPLQLQAPRHVAAGTPPPPSRASRGRRVLVIEDAEDAAESLRDALELSGHEVRVASSGPSGIALARTFRPEILLCDVGLPGMDGYAVARAFRADPALRDVYLVALTGYAGPEDRARAVVAGFDRHIAKPSSAEVMDHLLAEAPAHPHP